MNVANFLTFHLINDTWERWRRRWKRWHSAPSPQTMVVERLYSIPPMRQTKLSRMYKYNDYGRFVFNAIVLWIVVFWNMFYGNWRHKMNINIIVIHILLCTTVSHHQSRIFHIKMPFSLPFHRATHIIIIKYATAWCVPSVHSDVFGSVYAC